MSCQHGNPIDACDLCDELLAEFRSGIEQGKKDGWEACEACHGIVDGKHTEAESLRKQIAAKDDLLRRLQEDFFCTGSKTFARIVELEQAGDFLIASRRG